MNNVTPVKLTTPSSSLTTSPLNNGITNTATTTTTTTGSNSTNVDTPNKLSAIRFEVDLSKLKKKEVDYKNLVHKYLLEQNKDNISSSFYEKKSGNDSQTDPDPLLDNVELPTLARPKNRLTEVINKIEKIYANGPVFNYGSDDSEDDEDDGSFIDDTEILDFDETLETEYGGYFVNIGSIKYKDKTDDDNDDEMDVDQQYTSRRSKHSRADDYEDDGGEGDDEGEQEEEQEVEQSHQAEEKKASPPKKKHTAPPTISKPVKMLDIESPEIEQLIQELEKEVTTFPDDLKYLPKKIAPLLSVLYVKLRSTNPQGFLPGPTLARIATFWKLKEKTIKAHLKKAYLEHGQETQDILANTITKLNDCIASIKKQVKADYAVQTKDSKPVIKEEDKKEQDKDSGSTTTTVEPYSFTKAAKELVFQTVKLNKEIVDIKNSSCKDSDKIIEKTSRATLYKKLVSAFPTGWLSTKSLANAYSAIRNAERKQEKKREEEKEKEREKEKEKEKKKETSTSTTTSSSSNNNNNNNNNQNNLSSSNSNINTNNNNNNNNSNNNSNDKHDKTSTSSSSSSSGSHHHHSKDKHRSPSEKDKHRSGDRERSKDKHRSSSSSSSKDKERHRTSSKDSKHRDKDRKRLLNDIDVVADMTNYKKHKTSNSTTSKPTPLFLDLNSPPVPDLPTISQPNNNNNNNSHGNNNNIYNNI